MVVSVLFATVIINMIIIMIEYSTNDYRYFRHLSFDIIIFSMTSTFISFYQLSKCPLIRMFLFYDILSFVYSIIVYLFIIN